MIHKAALASKTIPKRLLERMSVVIKVVNYVKSSALKGAFRSFLQNLT